MENIEDYQKKKITIEGKDYYTITDFAKFSGINLSTVYQRVNRGNIPKSHTYNLGKLTLISAIELDDIMKRRLRLKKIETLFEDKKVLDKLSDKDIDRLNNLVDNKE